MVDRSLSDAELSKTLSAASLIFYLVFLSHGVMEQLFLFEQPLLPVCFRCRICPFFIPLLQYCSGLAILHNSSFEFFENGPVCIQCPVSLSFLVSSFIPPPYLCSFVSFPSYRFICHTSNLTKYFEFFPHPFYLYFYISLHSLFPFSSSFYIIHVL